MPTSSQAMILRGSDPTFRSHSNVVQLPMSNCKPRCSIPNINYTDVDLGMLSPPKSPNRESCEIVKLDFSVTTSPEKSINGFQGVFAYDHKSKSYRWQICAVQPKTRNELGQNVDHASGDMINPNEQLFNPQQDELVESESLPKYQPSDNTQHFTTPTDSLLDISPYSQATELHGKTTLLTSLNIPPDTELLEETEYRELEQLGFRKRTTYSPSGALIRRPKHERSPLLSPQKCSSEPIAAINKMTKLSINILDPCEVPTPKTIPFRRQGFHPKTYIKGESIRKRKTHKTSNTLLDDVKERLDWDNRVPAPTIHRRRGKPAYIPTAVCFSFKDGYKYSHVDIKEIVETQTYCKVKSLLFDPLTIRTGDPSTLDRWVVTLESTQACTQATQVGIVIDGDLVEIRPWDAILKNEYIPEEEAWEYPCTYRLQKDKHSLILSNFLSVH